MLSSPQNIVSGSDTLRVAPAHTLADPQAIQLLTPHQAWTWRVLPLGWQNQRLLVAVIPPESPAELRLLSQLTGWPIEPVEWSALDLRIGLERYYTRRTFLHAMLRPVDPLHLVRAFDLVSRATLREALGHQMRGGDHWLSWLQGHQRISTAHVTALRAVEHNRPYLRTARFESHPGLALVLPPMVAAKWGTVPFYSDAQRLWVYVSPERLPLDADDLAREIGLEVMPVVIDHAQWDAAFARLYQGLPTLRPPLNVDTLLREGDWLTDAQKAQAANVQQRSGIEISVLARERGWLTPSGWHAIVARQYGFLPRYEERADDFATLRGLRFAETLGRRWGIVPLMVREGMLHVGLDDPGARRFLPVVEAMARLPLQVYLLESQQFRRAWSIYYDDEALFGERRDTDSQSKPAPAVVEWLVAGHYLTAEQLENVLTYGRDMNASLQDSLLAYGLLSFVDIAEVLSLHSGLPWFPLDRAPRQLTPSEREALHLDPHLIALLDLGAVQPGPRSVLVAVADPTELDSAEVGDIRLQPLIAPRNALQLATETVAGTYQVDEFLRYMVQQEYLAPASVPAVAARVAEGVPIDQAIAGEIGEMRRIYGALASFSDLQMVTLKPDYRQELILDALGRVKRRTTMNEVVQVTPYQFTLAQAQQWNAIVIGEDDGRLTIAIPDPLNQAGLAAIEQAMRPLRTRWVVASRSDIAAAITRHIGRKNIGTFLLEAGMITAGALDEALSLSQRVGVRVGKALVLLGHVSREELVSFLAQQQNLPFVDLQHPMLEPEIVGLLSERDARRYGVIPLAVDDTSVTVAMVDPLDSQAITEVEALLEKKVIPTITTEDAFESALEYLYHDDYTYRSTQELIFRHPEESAYKVLTRSQKITFAVIGIISVIALFWNAIGFFIFVNLLTTAFYLAFSGHRFYLVYRALSNDLEVQVSDEEIAALKDRDLPMYTILIPLYKEAAVLPKLTRSLTRLDYPLAKLDVKLLLEANDQETIDAARSLDLPLNFEHVIVPDSFPKTKPKACNYGLIKAKGDFVVIYDAEDIPDSNQLKKAVVAFEKAGPQVACIQAKLNYFNRDQNLLTRWFTIEYSMWFDLFLPGLDASGAPVPLGGTSNHFRRPLLEKLGAWDPYNVTEDADLGVRLYKAGYKTAIIDSTTFEEANSQVGNWIRQRSRWVKGYIQTWLVHMRHPIKFLREVGLKAFLGFNLTVGGTFLGFLLNPIYWLLTTIWFLTEWNVLAQSFPPMVYYLDAINLFVGNFAFTYINVAGSMRREFYDMVKYALLSPLYWVLMSIGAWKGFIQLIHKPFYWEKTVHGLDKGAPNMQKANKLADLL